MKKINIHPKQRKRILRLKKGEFSHNNPSGTISKAIGYFDAINGDFHVRMDYSNGGVKTIFIDKEKIPVVNKILNGWVRNDILNVAGLAGKVWDDNETNVLRWRLIQKAERNTFRKHEKEIILSEIEHLYNQVKKSLK